MVRLKRNCAQLQAESVFSFYRKPCSDEPEFAGDFMSTISVIILLILFCIIQSIVLRKGKNKWRKYIPIAISTIGVLVGVVIYLISYIPYILEMNSQSVLSENQYLALTICVLFAPCMVGSLLGIILSRFLDSKKIIYFVPFITFLVVYAVMVILGFGMLSLKEVVWLLMFFVGGVLLCKGKVWGSIFGVIPAIIFILMSTNDTGQVINIERPLGIILCIYYLICSLIAFKRKN